MYNVSDNYKALIAQPVRYTGISGTVTLKTGAQVALSDDGIDGGSLSIVRRLNRRGDFRTGGVYSAELSVGLKGFAGKTSDLDGARISLTFLLYSADRATSESVPLGVFYVDGATIRRRSALVTLRADDAMMMFDVPAQETSGTYYELAGAACSACGVSLATTQAAFAALPNGAKSAALNTARVQTWRDLLMYIGQATASFARIDRSGALEFVPITAEKTDGGVIIPVREIAGGVRFSTDFSDDTTRISRVFMQRNGQRLGSTKIAVGGSARLMQMELPENPLFAALSDDEVKSALNEQFSALYPCLNRAFSADFNGDPALDVSDYVRLRGGAIDTERGYGTGMITSQIWRYRGAHTIKCTMPASFAVSGGSASAQAAAASVQSAANDDGDKVRVQPKSQAEKEIDELRAKLNGSAFPPAPIEYAFNVLPNVDPAAGGGFSLQSKDQNSYVKLDSGGVHIAVNSCSNAALYLSAADSATNGRESYFNMNPWGVNIEVFSDRKNGIGIYGSGGTGGGFDVKLTENGKESILFSVSTSGMYVNGKKVLTEE